MVANPRAYRGRAASGGGGGGGGETISADVIRWDGNTGSVKVATAWPLKPGVMFANDMTKFLVRDEGSVEVAIGVSASRGRFPDGSLRSIHVQFTANLTNNTAKTYSVEVGGTTRTTANDISYTETIYTSGTASTPAMNHRAVMIPASSQYWCDTFVALVPLKPEASETSDVAKTFFQTASGTASTLGDWANTLDSGHYGDANGVSTWEHCHGYLCAAIRADSQAKRIAHYKRFIETLVNQCGGDDYYRIGSNITPGWTKCYGGWDSSLPAASDPNSVSTLLAEAKSGQAIGWSAGYLVTGWKQPWLYIAWLASASNSQQTYSASKPYLMSTSFGIRWNVQWKMQFIACAYVINATVQVSGGFGSGRDNTVVGYQDQQWMLDMLEEFILTTGNSFARMNGLVGMRSTVKDDGGLGSSNTPEFPIFQGMALVKFLSFFYDNIYPDTRIPGWIKAWADFLIGQSVDETTYYGQPYFSSDTPASGFNYGPWYLPFDTKTFAWVYANTGNTTYKTWALRAANARELNNPSIFGPTVKAFGEYFSGDQQSAKYYIDGGTIRAFTGAHPSAYANPTTYTS